MTAFGSLLRAEWTKFRTVRGWVVGLMVGAAVIVALGLFPGMGGSCGSNGPGCVLPVGPGGEEVTDSFTFVHQTLDGDGSITVRVASLTGLLPSEGQDRPGLAPWAKAGLIIKDGVAPGSTYAAVMVTGSQGVRMQYDYTHDVAGGPGGAAPRWLRLSRAGDTITGEESTDGAQWTPVAAVRLPGLPSTTQVGLFVTSPQYAEVHNGSLGMAGVLGGPSRATAAFDHIAVSDGWTGTAWAGDTIGGHPNEPHGGFQPTGEGFTVTGSGDIAPAVAGATGLGTTITETLVGTFVGLIIVVVVAVMFVTAEYRRGLIRTTVTATPRRGRILVAKSIVVGGVTFVVGLVAAAVVVTLGQGILRGNGVYVHPASTATEVRLVVGTAALLAVAAVAGVGVGALVRRSTTAVTAAIVLIVVPYLLALTVLPDGVARWLLTVTPAAAFALQQSAPRYAQVANLYTPVEGYFPLAPWTGFAVLAAWAALALGLAAVRFRRRDA